MNIHYYKYRIPNCALAHRSAVCGIFKVEGVATAAVIRKICTDIRVDSISLEEVTVGEYARLRQPEYIC